MESSLDSTTCIKINLNSEEILYLYRLVDIYCNAYCFFASCTFFLISCFVLFFFCTDPGCYSLTKKTTAMSTLSTTNATHMNKYDIYLTFNYFSNCYYSKLNTFNLSISCESSSFFAGYLYNLY